MNSIIDWSQPIIAGLLILMGFLMILLSWGAYMQNQRANVQTWFVIYASILTGIAMVLSGYFIANW